MGKSSAPPPPDYASAARETSAGNLEMARQTAADNLALADKTAAANRINQYTPYGSLTYSRGPGDSWNQTMSLTPQAQKTLDKQMAMSDQYADLAQTGLTKAYDTLSNPNLDFDSLPKLQGIDSSKLAEAPINAGTTAQEAIMSRLAPTLASDDEALRSRLANQGIGLGSNAYTREMSLQNQRANDLRLQSAMQGIGLDQAARREGLNEQNLIYGNQADQRSRMLQEQTMKADRPLNLINALRTGAQVQNPTFQQYAQQALTPQANVAGADVLGASQAGYNAQVDAVNAKNAATNGMIGGLAGIGMGVAGLPVAGGGSLGGNAIMGMFSSDRRMKENIIPLGEQNGYQTYQFDYKPEFKDVAGHGSYIGVMADEVIEIKPEAVMMMPNGYFAVNYAAL